MDPYGSSPALLASNREERMNALSHSSSPLLAAALFGPAVECVVISGHEVAVRGYVIAFTEPGSPRFPNGVECAVTIEARSLVKVGLGTILVDRERISITESSAWDPVPRLLPATAMPPGPQPLFEDLLAGYVAGLALLHRKILRAKAIAEAAAASLSPVIATAVRHAARGEVPDSVHSLFASDDPAPLLKVDNAIGLSWLRGLISAGYVVDVSRLSPRPDGPSNRRPPDPVPQARGNGQSSHENHHVHPPERGDGRAS